MNHADMDLQIDRFEAYLRERGGHTAPFPRRRYIDAMAPGVAHYAALQNEAGAIIDPAFEMEWHYSTPAFAVAAAYLAARGENRYLEAAAQALSWSVSLLAEDRTPQGHADFFPVKIMSAYALLEPLVNREQSASWRESIRSVEPYRYYEFTLKKKPPGQVHNWNALSLAGEYRRHRAGLSSDLSFFEEHLPYHVARFTDLGFYRDGDLDQSSGANPMAYDLLGRIALGDLIGNGYSGPESRDIEANCLRGAMSALFFQDPNGEYAASGRSAQHIWNEAALAYTSEWAAARLKNERPLIAQALRRAAQLGLASMEEWRRDDGSFHILKNRFFDEEREGFEQYSVSTTYNLWALWALASTAMIADDTIETSEIPSQNHSYVVYTGHEFHQVAAASAGYFISYDLSGDPSTDSTGLNRVSRGGVPSQLGPSESCVQEPRYSVLGRTGFLNHSPGWVDRFGGRHELAALATTRMIAEYKEPYRPTVTADLHSGELEIIFTWRGGFSGARRIETRVVISAEGVTIRHEVTGSVTSVYAVVPLFDCDGAEQSEIEEVDGVVEVRQSNALARVTPSNGGKLELDPGHFCGRTGLIRRAEIAAEKSVEYTVELEPRGDL